MNSRSSRPLRRPGHAVIALLVALYGAAVLVLCARRAVSLPVFALLAAALLALLLLLSRRLRGVRLNIATTPQPLSPRAFALGAGLCFASMLLYLAAYFPGGVSSDTLMQWDDAHRFYFHDWHPVLHTLLIWLLTRIVDHPAFVLLCQLAAYAAAVGYVTAVLARWRFPKAVCALVAAFLSLNPALCSIMTFIWKDCAFAICALFLGAQLLEIHLSGGEWLSGRGHAAALALTLALTSIFRHNGLAMTLPVAVWLAVSFPRRLRRVLCALLGAALLFAGVKGPLYSALDAVKPESSLSEVYGVPMVVLSHIFAEAPEAIDGETAAFLTGFASQERFAELDACGDWNEIKWYVSEPDMSEMTLGQIAGMALRAAAKEPQLAVEALAGLWQLPFLPFGDAYWRISPYTSQEFMFSFSFEAAGIAPLRRALGWLCRLFSTPALSWLGWCPGFALLAVMLACALLGRDRPLSALLLPAALIAYDLATALVLSSPTDYRFFLSTPMLAPLCVLGLLAAPHAVAPHAVAPRSSAVSCKADAHPV